MPRVVGGESRGEGDGRNYCCCDNTPGKKKGYRNDGLDVFREANDVIGKGAGRLYT